MATHCIDTRGLSCPEPLLMVNVFLKDTECTHFCVNVDNEASKENITRAVTKKGWTVEISEEDNYQVLDISL